MEEFSRTALLLGDRAMETLTNSHVAVFGIGGVGGFTAEALVRSGLGHITLVDNDRVSRSNINRQILALQSTVGELKTSVAKTRYMDINPSVKIDVYNTFFLPENSDCIDFSSFDYVVDAIDTVSGKLEIIRKSTAANIPVISSMGAGNKLDPTLFRVSDIYDTKVCPLAKIIRKKVREMGIDHLKVVYSEETPIDSSSSAEKKVSGRPVPGSISFIPSVVGLIIAGEVIKDISGLSFSKS